MRSRSSRTLLALCLSTVMLFGAAAPAAAASYWSDYGIIDCTGGDVLSVHSTASGWVDHFIDGQMTGSWYNGSWGAYNISSAPSQHGAWQVDVWNGWLEQAYATCASSGGDDDDDDDYDDNRNVASSVSGHQSCPGSTVSIRSEATGNVGHSVYGQTQGTWYNGSTFMVRYSHTTFESGSWLIWSDADVDTDFSFAYCW
jgi:hypothetical protein